MTWIPVKDWGQGLNKDGMPEELALGVATTSSNIRFFSGFASRRKGFQSVYSTPLITPYASCLYTVDSARFMIYAGLQKTYVDDGTTQTDITNANNTGGINDRFSAFVFNGVYIQNNGVNVPQYWGGSIASNLVNLPAWPAGYTAGFMCAFGNYLVAGDITKAGVRYRDLFLSSSIADPGAVPASWDVTDAEKEALEKPIAETNGSLIQGLPLGNMLVLYKDDALHFAQAAGNSAIFNFGRLPGDTGLLARGCVVDTPMGHVFLTAGLDLVIHNGQGLRSLITGKMRAWLAGNINQSRAMRSFLAVSQATTEVLACFPPDAQDVCTKALVWNWREDTTYVIDLPNVTSACAGQVSLSGTDTWAAAVGTWATDTDSWSDGASLDSIGRLLFTRTAPGIALYDASQTDLGADFTATLERTGTHFDAPELIKFCRGVRIQIDAAPGTLVYVQVGASMTPGGTVTWKNPVTYTTGTTVDLNVMVSGRFLAIRIYTTASNAWRMRSCQMDIVQAGAY